MSDTVSRPTWQIGVRVAFGAATANQIRWLVLREPAVIAARRSAGSHYRVPRGVMIKPADRILHGSASHRGNRQRAARVLGEAQH